MAGVGGSGGKMETTVLEQQQQKRGKQKKDRLTFRSHVSLRGALWRSSSLIAPGGSEPSICPHPCAGVLHICSWKGSLAPSGWQGTLLVK